MKLSLVFCTIKLTNQRRKKKIQQTHFMPHSVQCTFAPEPSLRRQPNLYGLNDQKQKQTTAFVIKPCFGGHLFSLNAATQQTFVHCYQWRIPTRRRCVDKRSLFPAFSFHLTLGSRRCRSLALRLRLRRGSSGGVANNAGRTRVGGRRGLATSGGLDVVKSLVLQMLG